MIKLFGNVPKMTHANKKKILNRQKYAGEKGKGKNKKTKENPSHHTCDNRHNGRVEGESTKNISG